MQQAFDPTATPPFGTARIRGINWLGVWTLYVKEVLRFANLYLQTVFAPVVTTLLYFAIFALAIGASRPAVHGIPFTQFLAPGLIMVAIIQNAFANSASSILGAKIQGNIVDLLMPPLSHGEVAAAVILGGVSRGIAVALANLLALLPFVALEMPHPWAAAYFALMASISLSAGGMLAGIWAEKFDHMASVTNFVILPLSFLSGSFYSVALLPPALQAVNSFNPFFYLIDGMRYGFTGISDSNIAAGMLVSAFVAALLWIACYRVMQTGWRLKA
ncbi:MAG: ABC transporter permease [Alphaproteobacteria bacterium]